MKGSYYEMGYQQGKMMKKGGVLPPIWLESLHETVKSERAEFADACGEIVRRYMPDFLDELQGISDALGVDYDRVKIWPLCSYARLQQSCSAVAISGEYTAKGKPLFIRTYDYLDVDGKDFTAFWTEPKEGYSSLGFSDTMSGRYCGFNEEGLAVASSVSGYSSPTQPGVVFSLVVRWALDQHSTTDEAIEFLRRVPHFHGWNFLLCDSHSNIARVETCPERVEVVDFEEGIGISTNHYIAEEMQMFEGEEWRSGGSTMRRYSNIVNWFRTRNGLITTSSACELAKRRVDDGGLCDRFGGVEGGTLWSWIHTVGEQNVLVSDGPPCRYPYREIPAF